MKIYITTFIHDGKEYVGPDIHAETFKNALLIASRILGYGKEYEFEYDGKTESVDLTELENKPINEKEFSNKNLFVSYIFHPLMTFKVIVAIHYEAFKLWLKGIKFIKKKLKIKNKRSLLAMLVSLNKAPFQNLRRY